MRRLALAIAVALFAGLIVSSQEKKEAAEFKVPPEEAKRANPIKPEAASIAAGHHQYASQCAMCHGKDGDGKGDLAEPMKLKMRDWKDAGALKDMTDGDLFYILTKGKGEMPGQEDRLTATQKWHMVNFIRSLARKAPPAKAQD